MKKKLIILPLLVMLLASSCELFRFEPYTIRQINYFELDNKTNNDIVCQLIRTYDTTFKSLSTMGIGIDSVGISYQSGYRESITEISHFSTFELTDLAHYEIVLYNLSDTTSFIFNVDDFLNDFSYSENKNVILFTDKIDNSIEEVAANDDERLFNSKLTLTVDDELLNIFSKDYAMLDEFADYYVKLKK